MKKNSRSQRKKKLQATTKFDKKIAVRSTNIDYLRAQDSNMKNYAHIQGEKFRLAAPKLYDITQIFEIYKNLGEGEYSKTGAILQGIYNKNKYFAEKGEVASNENLLHLVSKPETLLLAYKEIKGNKGAMSLGSEMSVEKFEKLTVKQKYLYEESFRFPDGMSLGHIRLISHLLRTGKYPWGTSRRIAVQKPGQAPGKTRPVTIAPFADRLVGKAIELVLISIYEPYFERQNVSFGFRPNKGTHDAIISLVGKTEANGMRTAIEGDIKAAYDTVNKDKLVSLIEKRVRDRKFIEMLKERLQYDFVEADKDGSRRLSEPVLGIPQGGTDSPFLFNIYMYELDCFVQEELQTYIDSLNQRIVGRTYNKLWVSVRSRKRRLLRHLKKCKESGTKDEFIRLTKQIRKTSHLMRNMRSATDNQVELRIKYVRYADDWLLLTNGNLEVGVALRDKIRTFLQGELELELSMEKTQVTNITKDPAHFLGFEIKGKYRGNLRYVKKKNPGSYSGVNLQRISGLTLWCQPDRERLINRLYIKGFCDKNGFPREVPWISCLEAHTIVQRYNSVIRGLAEYYLPVVRNPSTIHRWIYILRFSCLKTLAQKYRTSIKGIYKRFGCRMGNRSLQTIEVTARLTIQTETFEKRWKLLCYSDVLKLVKYEERRNTLVKTYWDRQKKREIGNYPLSKGSMPKVTNEDYLEKISWVSWRTAASFDMPCAVCGSFEQVHQHHIKHIRKRSYVLIPDQESYKRMMALRNRKQIPLCSNCHLRTVHNGKYSSEALIKLAPNKTLVDNRIIHVESFVKPGKEYHAKTLEEKGWIKKCE